MPVEVQVPLLLKILSFDRSQSGPESGPLVMGVVFQGRNRASLRIGEEIHDRLTAAGRGSAAGRSIRVVLIDLDQTDDLRATLIRDSIRVVYVAPLRGVEISTVAAATRERLVVTLTGVPRYVLEGIAVGLDVNGPRPQIVINLAASRASGAVFSAQLLKVARLTDRDTLTP